jgi:hypothetical protein
MSKYGKLIDALTNANVSKSNITKITKHLDEINFKGSVINSNGFINPKTMEIIKGIIGGTDSWKILVKQNPIITKKALQTLLKSKKISKLFKNGKLIVDVDDLGPKGIADATGKSVDDVAKMAARSDVQDAAKTRTKDLVKLGIAAGSVLGIVFLMLATGKNNPVEAIAEALKAAAKTTAGAGADIFQNLFKGGLGGLFNVSALFLFCSSLLLILYLVGSVVLKS